MKIQNLTLRNFKGIKDISLDFQGRSATITGDNGTGKTSLADAWNWLLFNKDSLNRSDFEIKELDSDGNVVQHGLEHEVSAILSLDNREISLCKVYSEKWTKKKGSANKVFTGHQTEHFIDGVPVKKGEYQTAIAGIIDEDTFHLLTNPRYFNDCLNTKQRRDFLFRICGDVTDEDVIASKKELSELLTILKGKNTDDHHKIVKARMAEINKELDKIPARTDEAKRAQPELPTFDIAAIEKDKATVEEQIQLKNQELARITAGGEVAEKTKQLREIEAEIARLSTEAYRRHDDKIRKLQEQMAHSRAGMMDKNTRIPVLQRANNEREKEIESLVERMAIFRDRWRSIADTEFQEPETDDFCPTCGQALPAEQIEQARSKAKADFNRRKAEDLQTINEEGKIMKEKVDAIRADYADAVKQIEALQTEIGNTEATIRVFEEKVEALRLEAEKTEDDPAVGLKLREKKIVEDEIRKLEAGSSGAKEKVESGIRELNVMLESLEESKAKIEMHDEQEKRIQNLMDEQQRLAAEYEGMERELNLCENFIRTKVSMVEKKIRGRFKLARFKVFNVLVNGGLDDCCVTTFDGVPWDKGLNNGAQQIVGIDIINTLSEHFNFVAPIFVDNAESVTKLPETKAQVIRLVVSEPVKKLKVEYLDEAVVY